MMRALLAFALATLGALGVPSPAIAQQPVSPHHIGFVLVGFSLEDKELQAFRMGLSDAGYSEDRDVIIEWRLANGDYAKVPQLVADLVQRKADVILVESTTAALAAQQATSTIPIVMTLVGDPFRLRRRHPRSTIIPGGSPRRRLRRRTRRLHRLR